MTDLEKLIDGGGWLPIAEVPENTIVIVKYINFDGEESVTADLSPIKKNGALPDVWPGLMRPTHYQTLDAAEQLAARCKELQRRSYKSYVVQCPTEGAFLCLTLKSAKKIKEALNNKHATIVQTNIYPMDYHGGWAQDGLPENVDAKELLTVDELQAELGREKRVNEVLVEALLYAIDQYEGHHNPISNHWTGKARDALALALAEAIRKGDTNA